MEELQIFNIDHFVSFAGISPDQQLSMGELFIKQSEEYLGNLKHACVQKNHENFVFVAHQMKGMASFAGTERLRDICFKAEKMENVSDDKRNTALSIIKKEAEKAVSEVQLYLNTLQ